VSTTCLASWFGFIIVVVGILGAFLAGILGDKTKKYKILLLVTFGGTLLSLIWFILAVRPNNTIVLGFACGFLGLFVTAILPLSLEVAVECSYPVPEAVSAGGVMMAAQGFGILFILVMDAIGKTGNLTIANWLLVGTMGLSCVMMCLFKEDYKRTQAESRI